MKLSACIIMKDAAEDIGDCLESLKDQVDEIVVVDTGSTDDSVAIARRYTEKVYFFAWRNDFAAAKNYCLDHATGDWVVFLDSDEYLTKETRDNLRRIIVDMDAQGWDQLDVCGVNVDENHMPLDIGEHFNVRMFRNDPLRRYRGAVHEELVYADSREDKIVAVRPGDLCLHHKGYSPSRMEKKFQRNLQMLEQMEKEGKGRDLLDYYLSGMYFMQKDYEKAFFHAKRAVEDRALPNFNAFGAWRWWYISAVVLGHSQKEREQLLKRGMKAFPKMPDFYADYGILLLQQGKTGKAWEQLQKAERLMGEVSVNYPRERNLLYRDRMRLYRAMGEACLLLGKPQLARHYGELDWASRRKEEERGYASHIPPKSRCVMEFGCGEGVTGRAFFRIHPGCRYIGVEADPVLRRAAGRYLSEAASGTPMTVDPAGLAEEAVDCILYQDRTLWGLTAACLRKHSESLSPEGQMIFVLENVCYFRYVMKLLQAPMEEIPQSGISLQNLAKMVSDAGLHVLRVEPVYLAEDEKAKEDKELQVFLKALDAWHGEDAPLMKPDFWAARYLVRVTKKPPEQKLLIQAILGEPLVSGRVRVGEPQSFLGTAPGVLCLSDDRGANLSPNAEFSRRVLLRQRQRFQDQGTALQQIDLMRRAGCLIVYETDVLPPGWGNGPCLDIIGAHAVQVPTRALAEELRSLHPHVKVLENGLAELPPERQYVGNAPLTVFYGGANRRPGDWQDILPVLKELAESYRGKLRFRIVSDLAFFRALECEDKEFVGIPAYFGGRLIPYGNYGDELGRADIVLLPLQDTLENRIKSDQLFLEAAARGATVLASPTVYGETLEDGRMGFLYRNPEEFHEKFVRLVEDEGLRHGMAREAYGYVGRERLLCRHYEERLSFYHEMLDRREMLDEELAARLAGIGYGAMG